MKKIPMRKCVVSNEVFPKNELIRIVKTPNGEVVVDVTGKVNGHGAYLKKSLEIVKLAQKRKVLDRILETTIPDSVYLELENIIHE
mgnify:CR=1 FL=1